MNSIKIKEVEYVFDGMKCISLYTLKKTKE